MASPELLNWPAGRPVYVSGPPGGLRFPVKIGPAPAGALALHKASLIDIRGPSGHALVARSVKVGFAGGEANTIEGRVRLRLDPATPPGRYAGSVEIAGVARSIEIDVLEQVDVAIRPSPLILDLSLGLSQQRRVTFENRGNVPLRIDVASEYPIGEETPVVPASGINTGARDAEQLVDILDELLGAHRRAPLKRAGAVRLTMAGGSFELAPSAIRDAEVELIVSGDLLESARYRAFVPVYNSDLEIVVVTAAKHSAAPSRASGKASRRPAKQD